MTITKTAVLTATLLAAGTGAALADWPTDRPIELIVAFAPGGGTDIMLRTLAPFLETELDAQFPVLNRPGASGEIAYTALSQARPDGYTVSSLNTPGFLTMQIGRKLRYDPADICPIARIVEDPGTFIVQAGSEYKSLTDLVAFAKANPGAVSVGTTGVGTDEHLAMLQLEQAAGIDLTAVPFGGANEAKTALLGGHVAMIGLNVGEYTTSDRSSFRALAQFAEQRSTLAPDLPTAKEQGFDVLMSSERGLAARCDVPEDIRAKLATAVDTALANPEFQEKAKQQALPLSFKSGKDWQADMPARLERFTEIFKMIEGGQ
ncbi:MULTISPECIES: tripartite tricarboxylate transporter substrate binding protein [Paracoccus]|uniref:Tripartite tricarboxylate transporter substrate binding protein n=1 Tax=Paracoccus litorisediminis TaxID=2006130 RepID=A0A844HLM2_9RHOB|nr:MULTISPECIES: tripartite tricarboxylate transporter substrate binding protein [Paracoccus]MBD9527087.1 tripartite tricarboxylate transporter substrate binding protein [Paracoccus sp. PAR01]MTH59334.1 tripartite tricarboxylate transporter substrate binding protein [Paracoccus litorisediminis]